MYFPVAEAHIPVMYLVGIGFAVGVCGGFWGMGGGWMVTPALYALGVPMNIAVGTDMAHILGKSLVATFRHFKFGNVSVPIALAMIPGTVVGIEVGASIIEALKASGVHYVNRVLSAAYVVLLGGLAAFTVVESLLSGRALARQRREAEERGGHVRVHTVEDRVAVDLSERIRRLSAGPGVSCRVSGLREFPMWAIIVGGALTGLLAGLLGTGGGFMRMPFLVYVIGCPTHVAVGTDLLEIIATGSYGTLTHALKGNVDVLMAAVMLLGASVGAQVGTFATRYVQGTQLRNSFGIGILAATGSMVANEYLHMPGLSLVLALGGAGGIAAVIIGYLVHGIASGGPPGRPAREVKWD